MYRVIYLSKNVDTSAKIFKRFQQNWRLTIRAGGYQKRDKKENFCRVERGGISFRTSLLLRDSRSALYSILVPVGCIPVDIYVHI